MTPTHPNEEGGASGYNSSVSFLAVDEADAFPDLIRDLHGHLAGQKESKRAAATETIVGPQPHHMPLPGESSISTPFGGIDGDRLIGRAGRDRLRGDDGDDTLSGGSGGDVLIGDDGDDVLNGGSGKDRLVGGSGNDRLTGGRQRDKISGGPGNDRISARDGSTDSVNCGSGFDRATVDREDYVTRNCERVLKR